MDRAKYIILEGQHGPTPIIFPVFLEHAVVRLLGKEYPLISAGFVRVMDGQYVAFGESLSLKVEARPEDTRLLNRLMGATL